VINLNELSNLHVFGAMDLALHWASRGLPVLPTNPDTKAPWVGKKWEQQATTDPAAIQAWHSKWDAGARVGIKTGLACGCGCLDGPDVLDFDVTEGKPGIEQRRILVDAGILDGTKTLRLGTPSGGEHWWFQGTSQHNKQNDDSVWGVDLRAHHGMVLAPGNPGYEVKSVPWEDLGKIDWEVIRECPGLLIKPGLIVSPPSKLPPTRSVGGSLPGSTVLAPQQRSSKLVAPAKFDNAPGEESPMDWYTRTHDFAQLLVDDGWKYAYTSEGRDYYVRPGKETKAGASANVMINADGRQTLINFSTSVDLPTDRGMSAAQWYAYRYHGGNFGDAARAIRQTMMPRRAPVPAMPLGGPGTNQTALAGTSIPPGVPVAPVATPGAELVPTSEAGAPEPVREFWRRRRELQEVWWKAQVGGVSPWAVLGGVLAGVAARIGPHIALPPLGGVGGSASLNVLIAISGNSGTGKGRSGPIAREFMGAPYPKQRKPGTGQGIAAFYTEQTKEGPVQVNDTVVFNVAEITALGAHMGQQGATITSTLLEVYMGEELGEHYANKELRRPVKDGHYRLALVAGVQPGNSHIVFDHAESGLPQRFIWLPAFWPDSVLPEGPLRPPAPGSELHRWRAWSAILPGSLDDTINPETGATWSPTDAVSTKLQVPHGTKKAKEPEAEPVPIKEPVLVVYSPRVRHAIETDHSRRLNALKKRLMAGEDDPGDPDSHLLLTRAKVATLLSAWLDSSIFVSDEMWELAGWVIWVSNDTRMKAQARLRQKAAEKTAGRAAQRVTEAAMVSEAAERTHNATYIRACDRLLHLLMVGADWMGVGQLNRKMASKEKKAMREAGIDPVDVLADLEQAGKIETREPTGVEQGIKYRAK
jgi:hypothetical protein